MKSTIKNIFYNAHHSPVGAFASFTLGHKGASGGLGLELAGPANQNVYIGIESATPGQFKALPFYDYGDDRLQKQNTAAIPNGTASRWPNDALIAPFEDGEITRMITPGTDTWRAGELEFTIYTPHPSVPDPETENGGIYGGYDDDDDNDDDDNGDDDDDDGDDDDDDDDDGEDGDNGYDGDDETPSAGIPAVFVELTFDNTKCKRSRRAFFGYEGNDPYAAMRRVCDRSVSAVTGVGQGVNTGIFTKYRDDVECALAYSVNELLVDDIANRLPFGLGTTGLIIMTVPAGEKRTWRFAVCFYRSGCITAGARLMSYAYTEDFMDIEGVAEFALNNFDYYKNMAARFDIAIFENRNLSAERRFLMSMAIKSYYGSTQLLVDTDEEVGVTFWIVVEGGYRMINTLDLAVDHLFFEMARNPWAVRSVLEQYAIYYHYEDAVKTVSGDVHPGGISFTHDMGVANVFSPYGQSAYELAGLKGCYSYMAQEELVNWILCAGVYWYGAGDDEWLKGRIKTLEDCLTSMLNRDGVSKKDRDGVMDLDSCKTGSGGEEITTYDNVDTALGRARRSSYLAVKCWAAYLLMEKMFAKLGAAKQAKIASDQAERCAKTVLKYKRADGTIPALLESGNEAITLSIVEGLAYPYVTKMFNDPEFVNKYGDFVNALKVHFQTALANGCKFPSGAWKMSKTSDNSWPSKTFLCQFVSERVFGMQADAEADVAHVSWLLDPDNSRFAFSDQLLAGKACGSLYYPRGVTSILWL